MKYNITRTISLLAIILCVVMLVLSITIKYGGTPWTWGIMLMCNITIFMSDVANKKDR